MNLLDYFRTRKKSTASTARDRLQIIVAHERRDRTQPDYIRQMENDIVAVIRKYVTIAEQDVSVTVDASGECSILELNVTLPEAAEATPA